MRTYALDSNNNLIIDKGRFVIVEDGAAVAVKVRSRLLTYLGEWYLDENAGVPYFQQIFKKPVDLDNVESILKQVILQTDGVESLTEFSSSYDGTSRGFTVDAKVKTVYGTIEEITTNV